MINRLPREDLLRLQTFAIAIAQALTGNSGKSRGDNWKFPHGLYIHCATGIWYCFPAGDGGQSPVRLIQLLGNYNYTDAVQWALLWLTNNPGTGACTGAGAEDGDVPGLVRRVHDKIARWVLDRCIALTEPVAAPAVAYLTRRNLPPPYPDIVSFLPDTVWHEDLYRPGEGALVGRLTAKGSPCGAQLGWLTPQGVKSLIEPTRQLFLFDTPQRRAAVFDLPVALTSVQQFSRGPFDRCICEGLENALSCALAGLASAVHGVPGIDRLRHLPAQKGERIVVFRDGDPAGSPADKGLIAGVDNLLLQDASVFLTQTPQGQDANSLLQGGAHAP